MKYENTYKVMNEMGEDLVQELKDLLQQEGKDASGDLINSLSYQVVETDGIPQIQIWANNYLINVDEGRRAGSKQPPSEAIETWIKEKGIQGRDKKGRFITRKSTAFLIARSIGKKGIKPTNVIEEAINNVLNKWDNELSDAIADDYVIELNI